MGKTSTFLVWLLASSPLLTAQAQDIAPTARLYLGLQANYLRYPLIGQPGAYPLAASIGCLSDHQMLELGFSGHPTTTTQLVDDGTTVTHYRRSTQAYTLLVRRQLQWTTPASRWGMESSVGAVRLVAHQVATTYEKGASAGPARSYPSTTRDLQLVLGLGTSYRLTPHWQLTGEVQGQLSFIGLLFSSRHGALGGGALVGTRYNF